ncbi:DNA-DIRECTED RNA polymerase D SUBUNIT 2B-RELATED [Salix purpurea]|uniref:DNA-directed RNA polymerase n=1 Tax=Salix purpurea TaxID=77065 RepID=A0A9Q0VI17_SALPP|nr:DNA-DIRECTED RNA polymerase D SUBUNIT 2B-RELATED [Salix purpurea]
MGASSDYMEEVGPSSKGEVDDMDMDEDLMDITNLNELGKELCKRVFDSFGGVDVEPGYDTSKQKEGEWRRASLRLGKVTLNRPSFWGGTSSDAEHNMFPSHARLQNMTYSVRMKIHVNVQVYTQTVGRSDKFKTGIDKVVQKNVVHTRKQGKSLLEGCFVMVKSYLCLG